MLFVLAGGTEQKDESTRKVIRRHVMLGKNRGRMPRRPKQPSLTGTTVFKTHQEASSSQELPRPQPPIGSDIGHLDFADTFNSTLRSETVRFCVSMTDNMFTLSPCIAFDSRDDWAVCLQPLCRDALYANVMVFGSQLYIDKAFQQTTLRPRSIKQTSEYYDKSLRLLRERLPDIQTQELAVFDAVILAVYTLTMHALIIGDLTAARIHAVGLSSLVCGNPMGADPSKRRTKQTIELLRCDLAVSLATGQRPLLSSGTHQKLLTSPSELLPHSEPSFSSLYSMHTDLVDIWQTLKLFCADINAAAISHSRLSQDILLKTMASTMYRAIDLHLLPGSMDEAVKLAMLAFCRTVFLDWPLLRLSLPWLQHQLEIAICDLMQQSRWDVDNRLLLWVVVIHTITSSSTPLSPGCRTWTWLQEVTDRCKLVDWPSTKEAMSAFLWIDVVCDRRVQSLFDGPRTPRT